LENFDAVGAWRDTEAEQPIDASGELPGGRRFNGPRELAQVLRGKREQFVENLSAKLLTYALGRGLEPYDRAAVEEIALAAAAQDDRFQALLLAVVRSQPFQMRGTYEYNHEVDAAQPGG
jgi:Protein of unknown function (DUF1585)